MDRRNVEVVGFDRRWILRPDRGGVADIFSLLRTGDVAHSNLLECDEQEAPVRLQWRLLITFSIITQIIFLHLKAPVAWIGRIIEDWVNLVANQGFKDVISNLFCGERVVFQDTRSEWYRSIVGYADSRVELDENIAAGDGRYIPALTIMASKLAYENPATIRDVVENHWLMEVLDVLDCSNDYYGNLLSTQALVFRDRNVDPELVVVSFRGTQPFDMIQWCADVDFSWYEHREAGRIHEGFMRALGMQDGGRWPTELFVGPGPRRPSQFAYYSVRETLRRALGESPHAKFVVTGHSLGGALAILFPTVLMLHREDRVLERLEGVYTYGQPRVGDEKLGEFVTRELGDRYVRVVYGSDIVPRIPFDDPAFQYKHFGRCLYYDSRYHGQVVAEEPNKNYFSPAHLIPKYLNAWYELCRSFVIGRTRGREFREGWVLKLLRGVGLLLPGVPAHLPQDYVNSTRLGEFLP